MSSCEIVFVKNCNRRTLPNIILEDTAGQSVCQSCVHRPGHRGERAVVQIQGAESSTLGTDADANAGGLTVICKYGGCKRHVEGASVGVWPPDLRPREVRSAEARIRWALTAYDGKD